jgi:hypothetical protein
MVKALQEAVAAEVASVEGKRQPRVAEPSVPARSVVPWKWVAGIGVAIVAVGLCVVGLFAASQVGGWLMPTPTTVALTHTATRTVSTPTDTPLPVPTDAPKSTPTTLPRPESQPLMTSPDYGIQAFLWWRSDVATRDLGLIKDMGFRWVKQVFEWMDIEGAGKGMFSWTQSDAVVANAERYGIKLIARLDRAPVWTGAEGENGPPSNYDDFGDFCYEIAKRYKGRIHAYQIWNEPNLAREWGNHLPNPEEYTRLLSIAYQRIKEADPNAIVISAGLIATGTYNEAVMPDTLYLERMYQAGFQNHCDMIGLYAAGYKAPPEISPDEAATNKDQYGGERFFCFRHVEDMRAIMEKYGDADRRVVILEFGWTTDTIHPAYSWHAVTLEQQADYLVRAYKYAEEHWQPWVALMSTIYIADSDWTEESEEYWWAITYPQYPTPKVKPAYTALQAMPKVQ